MAAYVKFHAYAADLHHAVHNFSSHTFKVFLSNDTPDVANDAIKTDITEIAYGNGYAAPLTLSLSSEGQTGGVYRAIFTDPAQVVATGGAVAGFRYAIIFNDSATNDPLLGYYDYGSTLTLLEGQTFDLDLNNVSGLFSYS